MGEELPPLDAVTSARAVVLKGDKVLVMRRNADELRILPGGRREAGETLAETVERKVLEDTGWKVEVGPRLGFVHLPRLKPRPPGLEHPYPEFVQVVFRAVAQRRVPGARLPDDYETEAGFCPVSEVKRRNLPAGVFLKAATERKH